MPAGGLAGDVGTMRLGASVEGQRGAAAPSPQLEAARMNQMLYGTAAHRSTMAAQGGSSVGTLHF